MMNQLKSFFSGALLLAFLGLSACTTPKHPQYSVVAVPWTESLGNHRAVIEVDKPSDAVALDLLWRRHDLNPDKRRFIVTDAAGDTVANIYRAEVGNERCKIVFGPVTQPGTYYFYYLPYKVQKENGFYGLGYEWPEQTTDSLWTKNVAGKAFDTFTRARLKGFEARSAFDSFYPMEVIALQTEKDSLIKANPADFLIFPEDRKLPIRMLDNVPLRWVENGPSASFSGEAMQNEYYAFQLGVFASAKALQNLQIKFTELESGKNKIEASRLTCFNTGGIGPYGKPFTKRIDLEQGQIQPLWIGVDVAENLPAGTYTGKATVWADNAVAQEVQVEIKVEGKVIEERGDNEPWRHSRLRWLNSTLGIDDEPTKPYEPIKRENDYSYLLTGKKLTLGPSALPAQIDVKGTNLLNRPMELVVETASGKEKFGEPADAQIVKDAPGVVSGTWTSESANLSLSGSGTVESDGYLLYRVTLKALKDVKMKDVRLEIPLKAEIAREMKGMSLPGTEVPARHAAKWEGPHDSFWIGNTHGGLWCELRGSTYSGPLLNLYRPAYPASWYNDNRGGFKLERRTGEVNAVVYSGERSLKAGEEISFEWAMLITPVKDINYKSQFTDRYFHNGHDPMPSDNDLKSGVKIVNLHHANNYNPNINYPFVAVDSMKWFVNQLHAKGVKVKIYYTIRELTDYATELWALRSLGHEILGDGRGGGYPWLREHLVTGYLPQWYQWFPDQSGDASMVSAPGDSRWYNYYIEGLQWLVKQVDIDGLYLDDVTYDRRTVKRIRKVLDRQKPGCLLDLHSNTGFSDGPATQYTEFFPYLDKLWFGESFQYSQMEPANWLVEVSGIPFGLMGDMLHGGGNAWLGMVYGMTVRLPWYTEGVSCDPRPIWNVWDDFGLADARMVGFWEDNPVVTTNNPKVKATAYVRDGKTLIAIGNWSDKTEQVRLTIDGQQTGIDLSKARLVAPAVESFQPAAEFKPGEPIPVESKKGWLLILQ